MAREPINAAEEFDRIDGERGASRVGEQRKPQPPGTRLFLTVCIAAVLGVGGYALWKWYSFKYNSEPAQAAEPTARLNKAGSDWKPSKIVEPARAVGEQGQEVAESSNQSVHAAAEKAVPPATPVQPEGPTLEQRVKERRLKSKLGITSSAAGSDTQSAGQNNGLQSEGSGSGPLAENLQPVRLASARAGMIPDRDLMLTQGSMIDCQLETKIISTVPGMLTCYTTRDIYSTNGRVVLLDSGSKVVGQYKGGMMQGQARIFVLWTRVETPTGVIINLDSPGAGPLGEGGLGGYVDTHFWERFGGAIMLSLIGDVGDFLSNKASGSSGQDRIQFSNTSDAGQDMASKALENTINIPPTLYKNHGDRLQIFVARDLDFRGVYSLERSR
ncbi:type IV secretion system protein VirB10 [Pseudomonas protegens]|uniref:type IV secretion system protein VirB10 n=1 Tax=Pseudomonas protegens TaxID=380021 RepID=UPI0023EC9C09|nr:type IV secretion system protein VirB10 [Pseudomonas protegens]MDF4211152.1 type IV secretion system protein VirB10 [Pseudomonas protegens]